MLVLPKIPKVSLLKKQDVWFMEFKYLNNNEHLNLLLRACMFQEVNLSCIIAIVTKYKE